MTSVMTARNEDPVVALNRLVTLVTENPQDFLRPTENVQQVAIDAVKTLLDPLASSIASVQTIRRDENRKKRKRGNEAEEQPVLQLRQVYTKGFGVKQVWEQAKRILDAAQQEIQRDIQLHDNIFSVQDREPVASAEAGMRNGALEDKANASDESLDLEVEEAADVSSEEDVNEDHNSLQGNVEEEEDIEADSDIDDFADERILRKTGTYIQDPNKLNDGFFSIDDFNKQTQFLEQMDARGEYDNPSDEDEVDWDANPLTSAMTTSKATAPRRNSPGDDDEVTDEEEGPTFGDVGLDGSQSEDDEMANDEDQDLDDAMGGLSNANEIRYADFFEPPPKKPSKSKRMRALPKTQPLTEPKDQLDKDSEADEERLQHDLERAMADVRRDLLDSDEEDLSGDDEETASDNDAGPRASKKSDKSLSTHEKQRTAIAAEIRRLEAANVAKRDWQLSGEARAVDRPVNSLIEEDLEFERAGKPITPVTAETTEEIDALIKRRILAREFDEVTRRVPGSLNLASETRRGRIELDDTKPQTSLGEIYEAEHQKNADPLSYVDKRSAATKKAHAEIDILWKQVREQLDLLSNMHFKPKRVNVEIKTVEDKPRIAMEDARPVGEIESGEGGMLAPQEVYRPSVDAKPGKTEVMLQSGAAVSKEEMSREEKLRRRRRDKERAKKTKTNREVQVLGKNAPVKKNNRKAKEAEKANIIEDLKRGGVKVVGKGGELQNIGKQKKGRAEGAEVIGSNLKL